MRELLPAYEAMVREVGDDDPVFARMFTMWETAGCSDRVLAGGAAGG